ncbi:hypothetical protein MSG37_17655 [Shewanella sp. 1CM18E]|uniref:PH domain-containing protein n=1 Tax=Shewanella sp. 1CM18E TaxID=2929169 RepID=UPI0020BF0EE1|nr:PH domain-containing protein [Shewanella sp. 1CM18E]MCK8046718.1 hypothetical protein [Shewanella sp. 1CM18E]
MKHLNLQRIPLLFLIVISGFWSYYYLSSSDLNDFGHAKMEWLLFIDGLIVLPLLCFLCIKNPKDAMIKAFAYTCLIVLLGSVVIPDDSKLIWSYLELGRYLVLGLFIIFETMTIFTVFYAIRASLAAKQDPELAITRPIEQAFGKTPFSALLSIEARVWTYALFSKRVKAQHFRGEHHFSCHKKDCTQSNQLGFIFMILFELPIMHLVLHFLWSPLAANIVTGLTLFGLIFFIAEYRAIAIRPISITPSCIIIRYGVWNPLEIAISDIKQIKLNQHFIPRSSMVKRFNLSGVPNVEIKLRSDEFIYLGLDEPHRFLSSFDSSLTVENKD